MNVRECQGQRVYVEAQMDYIKHVVRQTSERGRRNWLLDISRQIVRYIDSKIRTQNIDNEKDRRLGRQIDIERPESSLDIERVIKTR